MLFADSQIFSIHFRRHLLQCPELFFLILSPRDGDESLLFDIRNAVFWLIIVSIGIKRVKCVSSSCYCFYNS